MLSDLIENLLADGSVNVPASILEKYFLKYVPPVELIAELEYKSVLYTTSPEPVLVPELLV